MKYKKARILGGLEVMVRQINTVDEKESEYDQEITHSHTADQPTAS